MSGAQPTSDPSVEQPEAAKSADQPTASTSNPATTSGAPDLPAATPSAAGAAAAEAEAAAAATTAAHAAGDVPAAPVPALLPASHWADLPQAPRDDDTDSAQGDNASSTASMSSSILQYRTIHGRTYHSERGNASYWSPNDEAQNEALDIIHHVLTLSLDNKLHIAPLGDNIQKVLDIGTGTGIWAIDFADEHPNCEVIGTDLSPTQPTWIPPNLKFEIDDCTQEWTFAENSFDYIHIRWLFGSIADWTHLFQQAYRSLKPGGYLESQEASIMFHSDDGSVHEKTAMAQFGKFFLEAAKVIGRSFTVVEDGTQRKAMEEAGFVDIQEKDLKTPIGPWPTDPKQLEIARFQQMAVEQDTEGTLNMVASLQGWTPTEVAVYVAHLRRELRSKSIHGYYPQKIVWARKP
ncbi:uncharacterized protein E0L32_011747 [Thyridium curvatum]|uniref:Methyltransferase n=1 Tax=Thyridium curvatum TaxID=1093900 RepID=A0A507BG53_9PEZI|nr:uncharacterized protein E0L32_011747 [Thyridium curvatum]TPX18336.1 hypothetical protein E0L32_011747 [Thyridium curvatum]